MDISNIRASELATVINNELKKKHNSSVNKICEGLGLKSSSVKTKFRRAGYIYDQERREYLEVNYEEQLINNVEPVESLSYGNESQEQGKGNTNTPPTVEPLTDGEITAIRNLLLQAQDNSITNTSQENDKFNISYRYAQDEGITRNIKISNELNTRLLQFIDKLPPGTRLRDLYDNIFSEFLTKYEE